jgi:hypothetical protein
MIWTLVVLTLGAALVILIALWNTIEDDENE